ncbi:MAG: permease-like cell division protein FtsX [Paludibacter sp.]
MSKVNNSINSGFSTKHLSSTISMSLVLFLVGLVFMLLFVARDMSTFVKENINLSIVLNDQTSKADEQRIEKFLTSSPYAKSVEYISKTDALKDHISSLGENPQQFLGFNPLKASIEVKLREVYANNDSVSIIQTKLKPFPSIYRIVYQKDMVTLVNENVKKVSLILIGLAIVLLLVSITLINNTIRLSLYSNRFLINTMKLVGATPGFIRKPFLIRSLITGFIAALISIILLVAVVYFIQYQFGIPGLMIQSVNLLYVGLIVLLSGLLLTVTSSFFAVGKYLKMHSNKLFYS